MVNKPQMSEYLEAALRGAALRQSVLANNIANMNTPGFRRGEAKFEKLLSEAMDGGKAPELADPAELIAESRNTPVDFQGNDVDLEMEVGEMIKNTALYKTYMRLLGGAYRKMELAMRDNI